MTADDIAAFTQIAALEALMSGTGFVWDHYYHGLAIAKTLSEMVCVPALHQPFRTSVVRRTA